MCSLLGLAYCTHPHQIAAAVLKKASAPELFFRQGSENKKFLRQIIDLDGRLQDWRYKMRRVLSQRKNVSHNRFCPANVFEFSKPIHCTETRSYDAALLASSSLDSLKRVGSAAAVDTAAAGRRHCVCIEMEFYADISGESRCNVEINV